MKNLSLNQKIIKIASILSAVFILTLEIKFLIQNIEIMKALSETGVNKLSMFAKLGSVIGIGSILLSLVLISNLANFKQEITKRNFKISVLCFAIVNLLLVLIFFITEGKSFMTKFIVDGNGKRNISYYFYQTKKIAMIFMLTLLIGFAEFADFLKGSKERKRQALIYFLTSALVFVNGMFLMITALETRYIAEKNVKKIVISSVVFAVLLFLIGFMHMVLTVVQRRAISEDKFNNRKLRVIGTVFNSFELTFALVSVALLHALFSKGYVIFIMFEYFLLILLSAMVQLTLSSFDQKIIHVDNSEEKLSEKQPDLDV